MSGHLDTASECPVAWIQRQNVRSLGYSVKCPSTWIQRQNIRPLVYSVKMSGHLDTASECPVTWIQLQKVRSLVYSVRISGHLYTASECPVTSVQCSTVRSREYSRCFMFGRSRLRTSVLKLAILTEDLWCFLQTHTNSGIASKVRHELSSEIGLRFYQTTRRHITKREILLRNSYSLEVPSCLPCVTRSLVGLQTQ